MIHLHAFSSKATVFFQPPRSPNPTTAALHRQPPNPSPFPRSSATSDPAPAPDHKPIEKIRRRRRSISTRKDESGTAFDDTLPKSKPRRSRRGKASAAAEDFVRKSLEQTLASVREEEEKGQSVKGSAADGAKEGLGKQVLLEEESPDWPLDTEVGWGVRASEYFEKHPIKNVVVNGEEIDWEGELDEGWVMEINCLEWESFAFDPSPLIVLVFERYNRAEDNWKLLKELEKATKVYWSAKDHLPPRTVKLDMNIEMDLAYALKVRECPQLLFLRGNRILYREKEFRTADELVQMIAHFFYNAKRPSWINEAAVAPRYPY